MKNAAAIASLCLLVVLGLGGLLNLASLVLDPPQARYYGAGYVVGLWVGAIVTPLLGALALWRLCTRPGTTTEPRTFTAGPPAPRTFSPGQHHPAPQAELVRPDVKAFFLGRR